MKPPADTETTGLHPDRHQIWEVALIDRDGREHVWQFPVDNEADADPFALQVGHYWERRWDSVILGLPPYDAIYYAHTPKSRRNDGSGLAIKPDAQWCRHFQTLTADCHLAGAVVSFDEERLRRLLWEHGVLPRWHYHLVDVEALAAGWVSARCAGMANDGVSRGPLGVPRPDGTVNHIDGRPPWNSNDLSRAVGVNPDDFDRHTALGDARWARVIYEKVMGL